MTDPDVRDPYIALVDENGHSWWRLMGANGETVLSSEMYSTKGSRNRSARRLAALTGLGIVTLAPH